VLHWLAIALHLKGTAFAIATWLRGSIKLTIYFNTAASFEIDVLARKIGLEWLI